MKKLLIAIALLSLIIVAGCSSVVPSTQTASKNREAIDFCTEKNETFIFTGFDLKAQRLTLCLDNTTGTLNFKEYLVD